MQIDITNPGQGVVNVALSGRLDTNAADELNNQTAQIIQTPVTLHLLCKELTYTASAGLRSLLVIHQTLEDNGGRLVVHDVQPAVMQILQMTDYTSFLHIEQ